MLFDPQCKKRHSLVVDYWLQYNLHIKCFEDSWLKTCYKSDFWEQHLDLDNSPELLLRLESELPSFLYIIICLV